MDIAHHIYQAKRIGSALAYVAQVLVVGGWAGWMLGLWGG